MLMLIKKDCRVNAVAIVGSAILQVMIYVVMVILGLVAAWYYGVTRNDVKDALVTSSFMGLAIMALMSAIYGAGAFALERRERSSDFLAMLPVKKWRIVLSKLLTAAGCLLVVWMINVLVLLAAGRGGVFGPADTRTFPLADRMQMVIVMTAVALMTFGLGWLFSTFLNSASVAATISIAMTLAMVIVVQVILYHTYPPIYAAYSWYHTPEEIAMHLIPVASFWTGLASLVAGTIYYLRRVEP